MILDDIKLSSHAHGIYLGQYNAQEPVKRLTWSHFGTFMGPNRGILTMLIKINSEKL